jgi:ParB family chromosome partitioning protein
MKFPAFSPIQFQPQVTEYEIVELKLTEIRPDVKQARKFFDENLLNELAISIQKHGIIQPIIVRKTDQDGLYELIAGERRWRAAQLINLQKIPAIIREFSKTEKLAIALIENIQRENLNALEEAEALQALMSECGLTQMQVADSVGKSRAAVSNLLRLLNLNDSVKKMVHLNLIEMGHARALLSLESRQQLVFANSIIQKKLSVRATERLVQKEINPIFEATKPVNSLADDLLAWKSNLEANLGLKINIDWTKANKGKIIINFNKVDEILLIIQNLNILH